MEKEIGKGTAFTAKFTENQKIRLAIDTEGTLGDAGAYVQATPEQLCKALGDLIPGDSTAEHMALGVLQTALELGAKGL